MKKNDINENFAFLREKIVFFFDLDGTLYLEDILFEGVQELIKLIKNLNKRFFFLSNNSSISTREYVLKLRKLGLDISIEDVIISTHPTIFYLKKENIKKIFLIGTRSLQSEFIEKGFEITDTDPEIIVLGFDKELTYEKLVKASYFLQNNIPFIATHPDKVCPTKKGYIPDAGAIISLLYEATGKKPKIFGKPNKEMLLFKLRELGISPNDAVIVGDRLYTDIKMGIKAGVSTICVLSGETTREMIEKSEIKPDIVLNKISDLINYIN